MPAAHRPRTPSGVVCRATHAAVRTGVARAPSRIAGAARTRVGAPAPEALRSGAPRAGVFAGAAASRGEAGVRVLRASRRPVGIALAMMVAALAGSLPAAAQNGAYPVRPMRMVVPYGAGGVSDILGRATAQKMGELLGQNVVVDNRAGAGGVVGSEFVANATPDGYTILFSSISVYSIIPHMRKRMPFDPETAFTPIAGIAQSSTIMTIGNGQPMRTVKEVIARARQAPGKVSYGSSGLGSVGHLTAEILGQLTGTELLHVPFKSAALAYPDAINGTITMVIDSLPSAMQHIRAGTVRPLAMLSRERDPALPDVPSIAEAGFPEAALVFWSGLHGPAGLPAPVVQRLADTARQVVAAPDVRERFATLGAVPLAMTGRDLAQRARADRERFGKVIRAAGIQPE